MAEEVEERFYEVVDTITRSKTVRVTADIVNEDETWEDVAAELAGMDEGVVSSDEDRDVDSVVNVTAVILAQRATTKGTDNTQRSDLRNDPIDHLAQLEPEVKDDADG